MPTSRAEDIPLINKKQLKSKLARPSECEQSWSVQSSSSNEAEGTIVRVRVVELQAMDLQAAKQQVVESQLCSLVRPKWVGPRPYGGDESTPDDPLIPIAIQFVEGSPFRVQWRGYYPSSFLPEDQLTGIETALILKAKQCPKRWIPVSNVKRMLFEEQSPGQSVKRSRVNSEPVETIEVSSLPFSSAPFDLGQSGVSGGDTLPSGLKEVKTGVLDVPALRLSSDPLQTSSDPLQTGLKKGQEEEGIVEAIRYYDTDDHGEWYELWWKGYRRSSYQLRQNLPAIFKTILDLAKQTKTKLNCIGARRSSTVVLSNVSVLYQKEGGDCLIMALFNALQPSGKKRRAILNRVTHQLAPMECLARATTKVFGKSLMRVDPVMQSLFEDGLFIAASKSHAITVKDHMIFDCSEAFALPLSEKNIKKCLTSSIIDVRKVI